jgi:hypothetical protein
MLIGKILPSPHINPCHVNRAFPLYEANYLGYGIFGRDRDQHVNMIAPKMPFSNLTLFLNSLLIFTCMFIPGNVKL